MHIVVCAKCVWDPEYPAQLFRLDERSGQVIETPGLRKVISPFDEQAAEAALRIRDEIPDVRVTILSFGPEAAAERLRDLLALGADDAAVIPQDEDEECDARLVAWALAAAVMRFGDCDLVLTGRQAADTDAGVVTSGIAELLGRPAVTLAKDVSVRDGNMLVERALEDCIETVEVPLPAVVSVTHELGPPRYASLRGAMQAKTKPIVTWQLDELAETAPAARPTQHIRRRQTFVPAIERKCEVIEGDSPQLVAKELLDRLTASDLLNLNAEVPPSNVPS